MDVKIEAAAFYILTMRPKVKNIQTRLLEIDKRRKFGIHMETEAKVEEFVSLKNKMSKSIELHSLELHTFCPISLFEKELFVTESSHFEYSILLLPFVKPI